jgi:ankyrin repeat protein
MVKYFIDKGHKLDQHDFSYAAVNGHIDIVKYVYDNVQNFDGGFFFLSAARGGQLDLMKYLHSIGQTSDPNEITDPEDNASDFIARCKDLEALKWLHENGFAFGNFVGFYAAENGSVEMLKYLNDNGVDLKSKYEICDMAAGSGSLEALKYLVSLGCTFTDETFCYAVSSDNIEVIEYVYNSNTSSYRCEDIDMARELGAQLN